MSRYNRQLILIYNHRWFIYLPSFGGVEDHQFKYDYLNNSSTWMILVSSDFENYSNIKYTSCLQSRKACACWNTHGNMKYLKISSDNSIGPQWWFTINIHHVQCQNHCKTLTRYRHSLDTRYSSCTVSKLCSKLITSCKQLHESAFVWAFSINDCSTTICIITNVILLR